VEGRRPLWAPWRLEYVERPGRPAGCIFCEPSAPVPDRDRLILHRGRAVFVLLNRFPYAPGHLMVAPYAHVGRLAALETPVRDELVRWLAECERVLEAETRCEGINVGSNLGSAAGAGFADHLHFHLVPRWRGDTNFMTAGGELRVIPEHLERSYERLSQRFRALETGA
jgi:ATP adenylyltransferase